MYTPSSDGRPLYVYRFLCSAGFSPAPPQSRKRWCSGEFIPPIRRPPWVRAGEGSWLVPTQNELNGLGKKDACPFRYWLVQRERKCGGNPCIGWTWSSPPVAGSTTARLILLPRRALLSSSCLPAETKLRFRRCSSSSTASTFSDRLRVRNHEINESETLMGRPVQNQKAVEKAKKLLRPSSGYSILARHPDSTPGSLHEVQ